MVFEDLEVVVVKEKLPDNNRMEVVVPVRMELDNEVDVV
jgi:hypothetical protein